MKKGKIIQIVTIGAIASLVGVINGVCFANSKMLNNFAYINQNTDNKETAVKGAALAKKIEGEGAVLVDNNGTLPLSKDVTKANVFGWSSTQWVYSGSGSGRVDHLETDFLSAMKAYGIKTNTDLTDFYTDFLGERPMMGKTQSGNTGTLKSYASEFSVLYEPTIESYSSDLLSEAKDFSDTAFVIISRVAGESNDSPKYQRYSNTKGGNNKQNDLDRTYLDISKDEEDLLTYVTANYKNTIVLVNSTNTMNTEFLSRFDVDACIVTGATGQNGASALPYMIYGEINPSGRLSDTYAYSLKSNPSYYVSGPVEKNTTQNFYTNTTTKGIYPNVSGVNNGNVSDNAAYEGAHFVDYCEDIYLGYKWYETADAEGYFSSVDNEYGKGYDGVVQYPFGYGMSYTSFSKNIQSTSVIKGETSQDDVIDIKVKVNNTGEVKGKETVQLYLTKPYIKGGIEKSEVELVDFSKTLELQPGDNELVEFKVRLADFADYDDTNKNNNGFTGYELEKGDYVFTVRENSHVVSKGDNSYTYNLSSDLKIETDSVTGEKIENRLLATSDDGVSIDGSDSDQNITYLSRADFKNTYPTEEANANRTMSDELVQLNKDQYSNKVASAFDDRHDSDYQDEPTFGDDNGLKIYEDKQVTDLGYELGADFNSDKWNSVLDQVTLEEATNLSLHGYTHNEAVNSIGKPYTREVDGPNQAGSFNVSSDALGYPCATVLAQTFNKELSYEYGKQLGSEAKSNGFDGLYAAGINMHRSPFCGRNYEYWSEDSTLTGKMAANEIKGGLNVGTYFYMKHFIAYDQETYRDGLYTWMTERNLRQNYLKPFVTCIREGGLNGIMTSYNRLGATWAGGNYSLIHELLEKEIGYQGAIITDYSDHQVFMNGDQSLRAGGSLWMDGYANNGKYIYDKTSITFKNCLREATKRNLYTYLNTAYINKKFVENGDSDYLNVHKPTPYYWWTTVIYSLDALSVIGLGLWLTLLLVKNHRESNTLTLDDTKAEK